MNIKNQALQVVVGILKRHNAKLNRIEYLFNQRPIGINKPYEGYWEFAGGKVEENETHTEALIRELKEELDIEINANHIMYFTNITHDYAHAKVELHFYTVNIWQGEPKGIEGQNLLWSTKDSYPTPILPSLDYLIPKLI